MTPDWLELVAPAITPEKQYVLKQGRQCVKAQTTWSVVREFRPTYEPNSVSLNSKCWFDIESETIDSIWFGI